MLSPNLFLFEISSEKGKCSSVVVPSAVKRRFLGIKTAAAEKKATFRLLFQFPFKTSTCLCKYVYGRLSGQSFGIERNGRLSGMTL